MIFRLQVSLVSKDDAADMHGITSVCRCGFLDIYLAYQLVFYSILRNSMVDLIHKG